MAIDTGTTLTFDLRGLAEDVEDVIFNIAPTETPALTAAKRKKVSAVYHQWQTDSLASAAANAAVEGDDSTYAAVTPTTLLGNYAQISKKTVMVSGTADAVRKYGRKEEFAYQIAKKGKELKRDIEFGIVRNAASSAGSTTAGRTSAGLESMIVNFSKPAAASSGATAGFGAGIWAAPTDGTITASATLTEALLVEALELAWQDGGDPSIIMTNTQQKRVIATFGGANKFSGVDVNGSRTAQAVVIGGVDLYISDFGEHKIMLNRYMRQRTILALDPEYYSVGFLRPIKFEERAKTGDATRGELLCEWTLIGDNPDAHAKVSDLAST